MPVRRLTKRSPEAQLVRELAATFLENELLTAFKAARRQAVALCMTAPVDSALRERLRQRAALRDLLGPTQRPLCYVCVLPIVDEEPYRYQPSRLLSRPLAVLHAGCHRHFLPEHGGDVAGCVYCAAYGDRLGGDDDLPFV